MVALAPTFEPTRSVLMGAQTLAPQALAADQISQFAAFPGCSDVQIRPDCINVTFTRGDTLVIVFNVWSDLAQTVPVDLSAATVTAQIRLTADAATVEQTFAVTKASNQITLRLTPAQTRLLPASCVWDCQVDWLSDGSDIRTIVGGSLTVLQDVTHIP